MLHSLTLARNHVFENLAKRWAWWMQNLVWLGCVLLALVAVDLTAVRAHSGSGYHLDIGAGGDHEVLRNFFGQETDAGGTTYRWTGAHSEVHVRNFGSVARPFLSLSVGGLPPAVQAPRPVHMEVNRTPYITLPVAAAPRDYHVLLPHDALLDGDLHLDFYSATSKVLPDPRDVGIRLDDVILRWPAGAWVFPQWPTLIVQWATVVVALAVAWRFEMPRRGLVVVTAGLVLLLGWMAAHDLFVAYVWSNRVLVASLAMLALFWRPFPLLSRVLPGLGRAELRLIGLVTAAAIAIRLLGVFYPHFGSHDLIIHRWRLREVQLGYLYLFDKPSEFGQQTVVPPAFYLLVMPFTLLVDNSAFTLQAAYALLDGSYALLVAILVRQIGGSGRAATLAAITTATLPIQFTALWWGFGPQIAGQWLLLLLALLVEQRNSASRYAWFVAGVVLALALLTHNSALFLGGVWLAGYVLLASRFQPQSSWKRWGVILLASSLVATLLLYADSVGLYLGGFARGATETSVDESLRVVLIGKGLRSSVRPLGLMLCVLSVVMVLRRAPTTYHLLVVAWLLSAGLFLAVDLLFGLQVRYAYFAIPVICAGFGLLLDGLMRRGRWGWLIGWSAIAITSLAGLSLWYAGVIWNIKPTLTALTH